MTEERMIRVVLELPENTTVLNYVCFGEWESCNEIYRSEDISPSELEPAPPKDWPGPACEGLEMCGMCETTVMFPGHFKDCPYRKKE